MDEAVKREFPLSPDVVYMNHAAVAPWPKRTTDAVRRFAAENSAMGALHYPRWLKVEERLRESARALINAPSSTDIALMKNTSEALSVVARGLVWNAGDNVVISDQEFPSNRIVWESLREFGVEVREASLFGSTTPEEALMARCDERTRLMSVSSLQYGTGLRIDLEQVGRFCRRHEILFCVDAIQSLGALPMDVDQIQADFLMADGHKWMLGPEGLALFFCRRERLELLRLHEFGWHMTDHPGDFDRREWSPAPTAVRFECGSPNMLGIHALDASLEVLLEFGLSAVEERLLDRAERLIRGLRAMPSVRLTTPAEPGRFGGIVTFRHDRVGPVELHATLAEQGVVCAQRAGGVRLSPHFYTPEPQIERVLEVVDGL